MQPKTVTSPQMQSKQITQILKAMKNEIWIKSEKVEVQIVNVPSHDGSNYYLTAFTKGIYDMFYVNNNYKHNERIKSKKEAVRIAKSWL